MKIQALIFDFDGVIVESIPVKTDAFRELFKEESKHLPSILEFHRANGGMSRFSKFDFIYRDILHRPLPPALRTQLGERFAALVKQRVIACDLVPGALEFLQTHWQTTPLFIISATPHDELKEIVERRKLSGYFCEVHGSPPSKSETARNILNRHGWNPDAVVYVGDALHDFQAAIDVGIPFIARVPTGTANLFPADKIVAVVGDLIDLENRWESLTAS